MISPLSHSREWIGARRADLGYPDPMILERAILALTLLDRLAGSGLDFVFKGGTALLLHLPTPARLSIDIDIVCEAPADDLPPLFDDLIAGSPFDRWDENRRGERGLPVRRHFRFHYTPLFEKRESHILLDIVTEPNVLVHLEEKPVATSFLEVESAVSVAVPRLESLLADKLTAFAPNTVGVPLTERFSQQVIKQLFDIAQLYDHATALGVLAEDNRNSFLAEARYRNFTGTHADYLDDLIDTAFHLCSLDLKGAPANRADDAALLRRGINQLGNHLLDCRFRLPEAKLAAAKAARLAMTLKADELPATLPHFEPSVAPALAKVRLDEPRACLNRLRLFAPEVFFYWATR
jgi:hypothetical protein